MLNRMWYKIILGVTNKEQLAKKGTYIDNVDLSSSFVRTVDTVIRITA